jgi:hypothetical protein
MADFASIGGRQFTSAPAGPNVATDVRGVKQTLAALKKLGPEYEKQFLAQVTDAVEPVISQARSAYPEMPLSGMSHVWTPKAKGGYSSAGRKAFPWKVASVQRGVKVKPDRRKNKKAVVYITQTSPAGLQFELAKADHGRLGPQIRSRHGRVLWPAVDRNMATINAGVQAACDAAVAMVNENIHDVIRSGVLD